MLFEGMGRPWWIAAMVVWLAVILALREYGYDFQAAARWGVLAGAITAFVVWFAIRRFRGSGAAPGAGRAKSDKKR